LYGDIGAGIEMDTVVVEGKDKGIEILTEVLMARP
jgi:hypothetical protein